MKDSIILEGKIYISAKRAARIINYAQDYIGQLCRSGKLDCKMVGRSWFVTEESLLAHRENAIDNTQERVLKVIKNNDVVTRESIQAVVEENKIVSANLPAVIFPVATSIVSPIQSTGFKYEAENLPLLPELRKRVPSPFALEKTSGNILAITKIPTPRKISLKARYASQNENRIVVRVAAPVHMSSQAVAFQNPITHANHYTTLAVTLVALGGFFFTLSIATFSNMQATTHNQASVGSAASEFFGEVLKSLGLRGRNPADFASRSEVKAPAAVAGQTTSDDMNGIAIFPASNPAADEAAKARVISSFSDEVTVRPDQSGAAGVIRPVFKKTNGDDFVYVMVPVNEKKQ